MPFDQNAKPPKCICCGQASEKVAIFARAY
ncbi:MAG: hypothetical protein MN733_31550 [Nitrososphaera sp.]|nr:hypothetical protein [Nitrososphaera sp.]